MIHIYLNDVHDANKNCGLYCTIDDTYIYILERLITFCVLFFLIQCQMLLWLINKSSLPVTEPVLFSWVSHTATQLEMLTSNVPFSVVVAVIHDKTTLRLVSLLNFNANHKLFLRLSCYF